MLEFLQKGGPSCGCSSCAAWSLSPCFSSVRFTCTARAFAWVNSLSGLSNLLALGNVAEAAAECASTPGPAPARVMRAVLMKHDLPRTELRDIAQDAGQLEVPRLERNLGLLVTIVYLAPLIACSAR